MALTEAEELELLELEALESEEVQKQPSLLQKTGEVAKKGAILGAKALPIAGGIAGATLASPGIVTIPAGAALGAAGGEAFKQLALRALGEPTPETPLKAAKEIGKAGLVEGVMTAAGVGAGRVLAKGGKTAFKLLKEPGEAEARALAEQARTAIKLKPTLTEKAAKVGKERIAPLTKKLQGLEQYKSGIKLAGGEKKKLLETNLSEAGKVIGAEEEAAGIGLKQLPLPKPVTKGRRFAQLMGKIADLPEEKLISKYDLPKIQTLRKRAQLASKSSGIPSEYKVLINQGREKLGQTLDKKLGESFEVARKNWQTLDDKIAAIPEETLRKQTVTSQLMKSTKAEIMKEKEHISKLMQRTKKIDARGLAKVEARLAESVAKAAKRDAVINKLKTAAIGAAGVAGLGGAASWVLK